MCFSALNQGFLMQTIHWAGAGLSAIPGLRRLIKRGHTVKVYNRSVEKAQQAISDLDGDTPVIKFDIDTIAANLNPGDIVVSMLPGDFHVPLAQMCLQQKAHFVSSSYISEPMQALHEQAQALGLSLVNEVGLDPGIDHSMAHALVDDYRSSAVFDKKLTHSFTSYCGGLSEVVNDFCYKFSWSPAGVLRALKSTSVSILDGKDYTVTQPWNAVDDFPLQMPWGNETFEVYPNRDSRPFIGQYHMADDWNIKQFVRGTLRSKGWKKAWQPIFQQIEQGMDETELVALSDQLWDKYSLQEGEADRVVLAVTLRAEQDGKDVWHKTYLMDAVGDAQGSAMAKLVSIPVSLAVEAVINKELEAGVSAAPSKPELVKRWLDTANSVTENFTVIDHCS